MQHCTIEKNMGLTDKIIRTSAASVLIALSTSKKVSSPLRTVLLVVSGLFLATSAVGSCPAYTALNISTIED